MRRIFILVALLLAGSKAESAWLMDHSSGTLGMYSIDVIATSVTLRGFKIWVGSSTVTSGVATFYPTYDNSAASTAWFSNIWGIHALAESNTSTAIDIPGASLKTVSADKKQIDVNVIVGKNLLSLGDTIGFAPNGTRVWLTLIGN